MKQLIFISLVIFHTLPSFALNEPRFVDPQLDQELLSQFEGLNVPAPAALPRFNLLIVAQDDQGQGKLPDGRVRLNSRADIIMVLSTNTATKEMSILSIYRDQAPTKACKDRIGSVPDGKINGVYSLGGREKFIPCLEAMLEENITAAGLADTYLDAHGRFQINAFFEGTRSETIRPVARKSVDVVLDNWVHFTWIYGFNAIGAVINVLTGGSTIGDSLSPEQAKEIDTNDLDFGYLGVELKERYAYRAGGFQRAFNFAWVIANVLGWSGYGIEHSDNYDFLGLYFGDIVNENFSRSVEFHDFEKTVLKAQGDHWYRHACYRNGYSPIKIIQWGEDKNAYSVFENGVFTLNKTNTLLKFLKEVPILPQPPSC